MSIKSEQQPEDLRVRRTHKFLWEALLALLEEHRFEAISVTDICERAMVHRATFYKHYESKQDLVLQGIKVLISQLEKEMKREEREKREPGHHSRLVALFNHFANYKYFYKFLLYEENFTSLQRFLLEEIGTSAENLLKSHLLRSKESVGIPPTIIAQFDTGAVVSVLVWWLSNDMPVSAEQMAGYLSHLLYKGNDFIVEDKQ
jgi:AcrR family transcriptional regulator